MPKTKEFESMLMSAERSVADRVGQLLAERDALRAELDVLRMDCAPVGRQLVAVKRMGALGRLIIPSGVRRAWGLERGAEVNIFADGQRIVLEPAAGGECCPVCGAAKQKGR